MDEALLERSDRIVGIVAPFTWDDVGSWEGLGRARGAADRENVVVGTGRVIDGAGNINLVGIGDYRRPKVRWAGSFGSAYLYFTVPRVILFREEHTRRVLVPKVDFVSAPGTSPDGVWRRGGPQALITSRCQFDFDRARGGFVLASVHPGSSVEAVREHTGFAFTEPDFVPGILFPTYVAYYQHPRVLEGLGQEPRPPFPKGYSLPPFDESLLAPVRSRGLRLRS